MATEKWLMCEWHSDDITDSIVQDGATFNSLAETREYVCAELTRFYEEVGDDLIPLDQYVIGSVTSTAPNIIYELPLE